SPRSDAGWIAPRRDLPDQRADHRPGADGQRPEAIVGGATAQAEGSRGYDGPVTSERIPVPHQILDGSVIAIGRGLDRTTVVRIGEGLAAGGIRAFEITFGREDALEAIAALHARFGAGDELLVGAGTILSVDDAQRALDAGAKFLVMPITDPDLVAWAAERGVPA